MKEFIIRQLDLKDASPNWRVEEVQSPDFLSVSTEISYIHRDGSKLHSILNFLVEGSAANSVF